MTLGLLGKVLEALRSSHPFAVDSWDDNAASTLEAHRVLIPGSQFLISQHQRKGDAAHTLMVSGGGIQQYTDCWGTLKDFNE